ncbi:hypothetical protein [Thalassotalea sp. SU-HH00458]|uniref:hypothetical protein n=1 Tax=Thalassotalea sp. SU-HH00458 TaxID=3127657 RepID=UPI0031062A11
MNLIITREHIATPKKAKVEITEYISSSIYTALEAGIKKKHITLVTNQANLYKDACIARYHQIKLQLGNEKLSLGNNALEKSLSILNLATHEKDIEQEKVRAFKACIHAITKMPMVALEQVIKERLFKDSDKFIVELRQKIKDKKEEVIKSISISPNNKKVTFVNVDYRDDLNDLVTKSGIHLFIGDRGTGKSELLKRLFEEAHIDKRYPIYMSASRTLSRSLLDKDDVRHYDYAYADSFARGALGVMLTLMLDDKYQTLRQKSETLIIDELEDVIDLSTAKIVGDGSLADRKLLLKRIETQISQAKSVIAADAFTCEHTIDWLFELAQKSGKRIYVYPQKSKFAKPSVKVMPYGANLALSRRLSLNNTKFGCFSDAQHNEKKSTFNAEISAINGVDQDNDKEQAYVSKHIQVDAAFTQSNSHGDTAELSALADSHDIVFYNSAAKNGVSILNPQYQHVSLLSHGTIAPNDLVQADSRFRYRQEVWLSFNKPERRLTTNPLSILINMINEDHGDELTEDMLNKLVNDVHLKRIAARMAFKNKMRQNYAFTVLSIYEHLGHQVEFIYDSKLQHEGQKKIKNASKEDQKQRHFNILSTDKIDETQAKDILTLGEYSSEESKHKLQNYYLRKFYCVPEITQELLDFDNDGQSQFILSKLLLTETPDKHLNISQRFEKKLLTAFIDVVKLHDKDHRYCNADCSALHQLLHQGTITVGHQTRAAKTIFFEVFKNAKLSEKYITSTIRSVFNIEFNFPVEKAPKKLGNRAFKVNMPEDMHYWFNHIKSCRLGESHITDIAA